MQTKRNNYYTKLFFRFLKEEGIFKPYIKNLQRFSGRNNNFLNEHLYNKEQLRRAIDYSFTWHRTPEGADFWNNKHLQLYKFVDNYIN